MLTRRVAMHRLRDDEEVKGLIDVATSTPNGEVQMLDRKIAALEAAHGMDSAEMVARVERGDLGESEAIGAWLMTLRVRDHLASVKARAR